MDSTSIVPCTSPAVGKTMKNTCLLILCGFLPLISVIYAYAHETEPGQHITGIAVHGLKRTKPQIAEVPLQQFMGQRADTVDLNAVHAAVLDTGILEPLAVEIQDAPDGNGKILSVKVHEKWSIFPLPLFFITSGEINGGLFFIDSNALGLNDKLFVGGMYSTGGWMLIGGYAHSPGPGFPGWNVSTALAQSERRNTDQQERDIRRFGLAALSASAGLSYPFTQALQVNPQISYRQMRLKDSASPLAPPESDVRAVGLGANAALRKSRWDGFLLSEERLSLDYTFMFGQGTPAFHELRLQAGYQKPLLPGFRVNLRAGLLYAPEAPALFESPPQVAQVEILPGTFTARRYAGASAGLEKHIFTIKAGSLSALMAYQAVFSEGPILGGGFDHGVAGAVVFYLSKLAIPAMALSMAYNVPAKQPQFSFSLGMSL
ncbi:MAG: hypothetical protein LBU25_00240 [Treponema sp.]|jgi:hypothetical protein|nr:hypothetical protein [Treponema sp.]